MTKVEVLHEYMHQIADEYEKQLSPERAYDINWEKIYKLKDPEYGNEDLTTVLHEYNNYLSYCYEEDMTDEH